MTSDGAPRETAAHPAPDAAEALWDNARSCLDTFATLFGTAADLVASVFIRRKDHAAAAAFLHGLESLVRRILVIAASRLVPTLPDGVLPPPRPPIRLPEPLHTSSEPANLSERPQERWPAKFRIMPRVSDATREGEPLEYRPNGPHLKTETPRGFRTTRSLALRLEAVRRVFDQPDYFIQAMAWELKFRQGRSEAIVMAEDKLPEQVARYLGRPLHTAANAALDALTSLAPAPKPNTS